MRKFNLEEALQGSPVRLKNGFKAYVFADVSHLAKDENFPLVGGFSVKIRSFYDNNEKELFHALRWTKDGKCDRSIYSHEIVGMWED